MKKLFAIVVSFALIAFGIFADEWRKSNMKIEIEITNESGVKTTLIATLAENSTVDELVERLRANPISLDMVDYSNFEKYGTLPFKMKQNDKRITTQCGDIMLTWGNTFVIYYDRNSYDFTPLGFLDAIADGSMTQAELKKILGKGNVKAVIRLKEE